MDSSHSVEALSIIFPLIILGFYIFGFILFIKLAKRGIKALDIYIEEKNSNNL